MHTFNTTTIHSPFSGPHRSGGNGHSDLNHNAPRQGHPQNGQRFNSSSAMSRSQREQTVESQYSTSTDSTIDQERVEVAGSSTPSSSASETTTASVAGGGEEFWVCCGGNATAVCPYDGTHLVALYSDCLDCQHHRCGKCRIMIVHGQPGDAAP